MLSVMREDVRGKGLAGCLSESSALFLAKACTSSFRRSSSNLLWLIGLDAQDSRNTRFGTHEHYCIW